MTREGGSSRWALARVRLSWVESAWLWLSRVESGWVRLSQLESTWALVSCPTRWNHHPHNIEERNISQQCTSWPLDWVGFYNLSMTIFYACSLESGDSLNEIKEFGSRLFYNNILTALVFSLWNFGLFSRQIFHREFQFSVECAGRKDWPVTGPFHDWCLIGRSHLRVYSHKEKWRRVSFSERQYSKSE